MNHKNKHSSIDPHYEPDEIKQLLRLQDEPYIHLSDYQIHKVLMANTPEFMNELSQLYLEWGQDEKWVNVPEKKIIKTPDLKGDFRVMPCITNLNNGIKAVKVIGTNEENRHIKDKISVGKTLLLDWHDNYVYAILDACVLSSYRTAAISLFAYSLLVDKKAMNPGLIGLGRIGFYSAFILHHWLGVSTINCYDNNSQIIKRFKKLLSIYAPELNINLMESDSVVTHSTSLFLATDSQNALLDSENTSHIKFISSVGADADNLSELHESILEGRNILTDSIQSMLLGDMKRWYDQKLFSKKDVIVLKDIATAPVKLSGNSLFISTGVALQDALISQFVVKKVDTEKVFF